jgi:exonuclease III
VSKSLAKAKKKDQMERMNSVEGFTFYHAEGTPGFSVVYVRNSLVNSVDVTFPLKNVNNDDNLGGRCVVVKDHSKRYAAVGIYAPNSQTRRKSKDKGAKGAGPKERKQWDDAFFNELRSLSSEFETVIVCGDFNMDWDYKAGPTSKDVEISNRYQTFMNNNGFGKPVSMPAGEWIDGVSVIEEKSMAKCVTFKAGPNSPNMKEARVDYIFVRRRSPTATTTPAMKGAAAFLSSLSSSSSSVSSFLSKVPAAARASTTASLRASGYSFGQ